MCKGSGGIGEEWKEIGAIGGECGEVSEWMVKEYSILTRIGWRVRKGLAWKM